MLLGFLDDGAGVEGPGEVLCKKDTKEFGALDGLLVRKSRIAEGSVQAQQVQVLGDDGVEC